MKRRTLLATIGGGTLSFAGCTTGADRGDAGDGTTPVTDTDMGTGTDTAGTGTAAQPVVPAACPTSQELGVEWPADLTASTVKSFVESYEHVYYREVVVDYEPESELDSYKLSGSATQPKAVGDGWVLSYSGSGGIYRPTLRLGASTAAPPDGADVVPLTEIEDDLLTGLLEEAAETGEAQRHVESPGERVDRYVDLLASLSDDFEGVSGWGDNSLYVDVDGTMVELTAEADTFHGDYWWEAWYYVDEQVVRRTTDEDADPQDGNVLECRVSD